MIKDFIPYKQALEIKKLGFNEECFFDYNSKGGITNKWSIELIPAPLYQQAFRWFREKHQMEFYVEYNEGAELTCLKKLIETLKNK